MTDAEKTMTSIWEKIPKNPDGITITYFPADLPYLYFNGFVDTQRFSLEDWQKFFIPFVQEDGNFILSRDQFLSLTPFRYTGPVFGPFDPDKLRRGAWEDNELEFLYEKSIAPSSTIPKDLFARLVQTVKTKQGNENESLIIDDYFISQLKYLIEKMPSPRRRLEKEVERIRKTGSMIINPSEAEQTGFSSGRKVSEVSLEALQALQGTSETPAPTDPTKPTIGVKSLKKPPTKFRG